MKYILLICMVLISVSGHAQNYKPLDDNDPVDFKGDRIIYQGKEIILNEKALYVDGQLSEEEARLYPFVYNTVNEAMRHLQPGTEAEPMTVYIAPYVYWVDNPDDPEVRKPLPGQRAPFALIVHCPWLKLYGLNQKPENVVLAVNRGQSQGAYGNFTLMDYYGDGLSLYNMTVGNYCNIDLVYSLRPEFNRKRRMDAITQAQLIFARGDKNQAHNVHFLSRLNLNPIFGAKRTLFNRCYFEMTDDSLCKSGVYLNCGLTFYSSKPFGSTQPVGGAVFLNCDFYVKTLSEQYLVKSGGPLTLIDTRYHCDHPVYIGWNQDPTVERRFYQSNVTLNGSPIRVETKRPEVTVDITDKPLLDAYKIVSNQKTIYNTYNLLAGNDDWDPMGVKEEIIKAEKVLGRQLREIPVHLGIQATTDTVEAGQAGRSIFAIARRHSDFDARIPNLKWEYDHTLLSLEGDNSQKILRSVNTSDSTRTTVVRLVSDLGLETAKIIIAKPSIFAAPAFKSAPVITQGKKGLLTLNYELDLQGKADQSDINWYRCATGRGDQPMLVKVSRRNIPAAEYQLTLNDVGYYIMAEISPKHIRSVCGKKIQVVFEHKVTEKQVDNKYCYYTDFLNFPCEQQTDIIPGFWTVDGHKPLDTAYYYDWKADTVRNWFYGEGINAARGYYGFLQATKGARLMFTPIERKFGDMSVDLVVAPSKTAAQGFGSATGQYLDVCLKFDTRTLTGYALRIIRTTKYHNAVDFYLVKYTNGKTERISDEITGICYLPACTLHVETNGNKLQAQVSTTAQMRETTDPALHKSIVLTATMDEITSFGGVAIQHTGSGRGNSTLLHSLKINWK